ncbi:MAG: MaoC family dehydratase [Phreatobacter sp.]|uniref:MaoC family dehydratase n=1 Tax=Phreatobacter sp. TaxID=1966341 RepID=UPI001A5502B8|nr:MaoC family dehydratase [Phreatobacter sp.]MBL8569050.1 MaoC family dehydratase [Phreatobacter sp.]
MSEAGKPATGEAEKATTGEAGKPTTGEALAIGHTFPDHRCGVIDAARVSTYATASGDDNPIHTDEAAARSIGLGGTIIQGMLLMALADEALAAWRPDSACQRLTARFARPAPTGSEVVIGGRVVKTEAVDGAELATLRIMVKDGKGAVLAMAEAVIAN